ncbi:MAG: VanZ family protein [Verrucomicrobiota bacterium]
MLKGPCFHRHVSAARFFKYWLPVILWMVLIFGASTNLGAPRNTSRIIGPFLRWLIPSINDETLEAVQYNIRKASHVTEYAILSLLLWRARRKTISNEPRGWSWSDARFAIFISAIFAVTDEFHQHFVATRQASIWDVLLDTSGAVLGIFALWKIGKKFKHW